MTSWKGLILSGGSGVRMRPFSLGTPKQLLPVGGRPVLAHAAAEMAAAGVTELVIVTSPAMRNAIRGALGSQAANGAPIHYVVQDEPRGLAHAVATAAPVLGESPFLMQLGDNLVPGGVSRLAAVMCSDAAPAAAVLVAPVAEPERYGIAVAGPDGRVLRLVEKPAQPPGNLALVGVYAFLPEIHGAIATIRPSARGELEITDALQQLVARGRPVLAVAHTGWWCDVGTPADLLAANRLWLQDMPAGNRGQVWATEVTGRVAIGAGARVERCRLTGPVLIGDGCRLEDAAVGPWVAVGDGAVLRRCQVRDSVILPGARIDSPARPLTHSVIGREAVVEGGAEGQLLLGDFGRVHGM